MNRSHIDQGLRADLSSMLVAAELIEPDGVEQGVDHTWTMRLALREGDRLLATVQRLVGISEQP